MRWYFPKVCDETAPTYSFVFWQCITQGIYHISIKFHKLSQWDNLNSEKTQKSLKAIWRHTNANLLPEVDTHETTTTTTSRKITGKVFIGLKPGIITKYISFLEEYKRHICLKNVSQFNLHSRKHGILTSKSRHATQWLTSCFDS